MRLRLIRNATLKLAFGGRTILVDPYFAPKFNRSSYTGKSANPLVDLPMSVTGIPGWGAPGDRLTSPRWWVYASAHSSVSGAAQQKGDGQNHRYAAGKPLPSDLIGLGGKQNEH